jgi:hypothetical protein
MSLERLEVWLEPATIAELRRDAAARGVAPHELAREAIEAFVDVERAAVLDPAELEDEGDEELLAAAEDDDWSELGREAAPFGEPDDEY